jgi:hypothetical protein
MNSKNVIGVILGVTLAVASVVMLMFIQHFATEVMQVAVMIAGMAAVGGIMLMFYSVSRPRSSPLVTIHFNEHLVSESLSSKDEKVIDVEAEPFEKKSWDVTAANLVGRDNTLALAKLRMDLEHWLRRAAVDEGIDLTQRSLNPIRLAEELSRKGVISVESLQVWRQVIDACNKAVHGGVIDDQTAESVVRVGILLISRLNSSRLSNGGI